MRLVILVLEAGVQLAAGHDILDKLGIKNLTTYIEENQHQNHRHVQKEEMTAWFHRLEIRKDN